MIDFDSGDDVELCVQFSDFRLQADQVTPTDKCTFEFSPRKGVEPNNGTEASFAVFTVQLSDYAIDLKTN